MALLAMVADLANSESTPASETFEADFDTFWLLYPRHEAKKDARKAWRNMNPADHLLAVVTITDWRNVWRSQGRETHNIPLPATWLNGERWCDELPQRMNGHQSHQLMAPAKQGERIEMPQHVKDQILRLRRKVTGQG